MNKKNIVPFAFSLGNIFFSIMKILAIIGAAFALIGVLTLSFLPAGTVSVNASTDMEVEFDLSSMGEGWQAYRDALKESLKIYGEQGLDTSIEITEKGFTMKGAAPGEAMENRTMALALIPGFVQLLIQIFFFHYLAKICKLEKNALYTPFTDEIASLLRSLSYSIFALTAAPALASALISLITRISIKSSLDLESILWGLLVLALAEIFRFGAKLSSPAATSAPSQGMPKNDPTDESQNHPNAF